ncbi:MAG TPA: hypothetical protein VMK31_09500 [Sphingomicrobium sp.]|nr:hypothetical protein [Sphingomicrobium sp.]
MRIRSSIALVLSLLACACRTEAGDGTGKEQGGEGGNQEAGNQAARHPGNGASPRGPVVGVELSVPREASANSTVRLALRNGSPEPIGYNLCTSRLESAKGRKIPTSRACTMELRTLEPGRIATYGYTLPVNMLEGSYRFATQAQAMQSGTAARVKSNAFTVRSD